MKTNNEKRRRSSHVSEGLSEFERKVEQRLAELSIEQHVISLREKLGLTQSQLAEMAGVSQPFIAKLESGRAVNIELRTLVRVATALGANVEAAIAIPSRQKAKPRTLAASAGRR